MKIKNQREQTRNRVRMCRGIKSIMQNDTIALVNVNQLKKQMAKNQSTNEAPKLSDELRSWAIQFYIKKRALSALLKILRSFGMPSLPADSRSLLKTPRSITIANLAGGKYWHNGIQNSLLQVFSKLSSNLRIEINLNMDGLPIFKSSPTSLWPILANVHGAYFLLLRYFDFTATVT